MEFNEKLQKLRADRNLTQEELAEKIYVSRTAISKWESGRGYPSIDSLKSIAGFFEVTIDELISGEEIVTLAEQDIRKNSRKNTSIICSVLDCLMLLLLFIPVFREINAESIISVSLLSLSGISAWLKIAFIGIISLIVLNGFCVLIFSSLDKPARSGLIIGGVLSIIGTILFILARQPYPSVFSLCMLIVKGIIAFKSQ